MVALTWRDGVGLASERERRRAAAGRSLGQELETAVLAASAGSARRPGRPTAGHAACANCGAALLGGWCHACGQEDEDYHRSALHLLGDVLDNFFHFDGRLWRTLPDLLLRPGRLTRAYLDGHRASQVPPLRLFLVCLLIAFVAGGFGRDPVRGAVPVDMGSAAGRARTAERIGALDVQGSPTAAWLKARLLVAARDPVRFRLVLDSWTERFAFLVLPLAAVLLSLMFLGDRRFMLFDHLIFALHSLAFLCLLITAVLLASGLSAAVGLVLLLAAPVHLFAHMRGVYAGGALSTLARMAGLAVGSVAGAAAIFLGLLWTGLSAL